MNRPISYAADKRNIGIYKHAKGQERDLNPLYLALAIITLLLGKIFRRWYNNE